MAATLDAIRKKVRRLTRNPSVNQLPDADLDEYINTFILYDFPEHLRLDTFRKTLRFWTTPYVDRYDSSIAIGSTSEPSLNNFKNIYTNIVKPVFVAGYEVGLYNNRNLFFSLYPAIEFTVDIAEGDGAASQFNGRLSETPILARSVTFSGANSEGTALVMHDVPVVTSDGLERPVGNLYQWGNEPNTPPTSIIATNTIDYVTGEYTVTFPTAPATDATIRAQTNRYSPSRPDTILFYNNTFFLRPIPDQAYTVDMDAFIRPTALAAAGDIPELEQWWQYIAYGAAKKILEDRMDMETVAQITPEFNKQELLVLRKTIVNQAKQRAATIYTEQVDVLGNDYNGGFNGGT